MDVTIQHPWYKRALGPFYPNRLFDQVFGEGMFDYDLFPFLSSTVSPYYRHSLFRGSVESGISETVYREDPHLNPEKVETDRLEVRSDRDRLNINLDVKHFSPDDLTVKIKGDFVEIHGKHNERQDDHGYISREFHRRYPLPSNLDKSSIRCSLSDDGILTFRGSKIMSDLDSSHERPIPVSREEKPTSS